jgi:hypothetical protein
MQLSVKAPLHPATPEYGKREFSSEIVHKGTLSLVLGLARSSLNAD